MAESAEAVKAVTDLDRLFTLKKATAEMSGECYAILDSARQFQRAQGFVQWTDNNPSEQTVIDDINSGNAYVMTDESGKIACYLYITFDGEKFYEKIDGAWHSELPYAAVHRVGMSESFRGMGLSSIMWKLVAEFCLECGVHSIRIDTWRENYRMQHVLEKNGFVRCGIVYYPVGERIAYDRQI